MNIDSIILYTNGVILPFNNGQIMPHEQYLFNVPDRNKTWSSGRTEYVNLLKAAKDADINIAQWGEWSHSLSYTNFLLLLGETDLRNQWLMAQENGDNYE